MSATLSVRPFLVSIALLSVVAGFSPGVRAADTESAKPKNFLDRLAGRLQGGGKVLRGQVLSEEGKPLANAKVSLGFGDPIPYSALTDDEGKFEIKGIPEARTRIYPVISACGHVAKGRFSFELNAKGDTEVTWKLAPAAVVTRKSDGTPVKGITVVSGRDRFGSNHVDPRTVTDENGQYRLEQIPPGEIVVSAFSPDFAPTMQVSNAILSKPTTVDFQVEPGKTLTGKVVDPMGNPVEKVWIVTDTWNGVRMFKRETHTKADGSFQLENMPETPTKINVLKKDYVSKRDLQAIGGEHYEVVLPPVTRQEVRIRLADKEEPAEDLVIQLGYQWQGQEVVSWQPNHGYDSKYDPMAGIFTIRHTEPSNAKIYWRFRHPGYRDVVLSDAEAHATGKPVDVVLEPAQVIAGKVVDPATGNPVSGVTLAIIGEDDNLRLNRFVQFDGGAAGMNEFTGLRSETREDGSFELPESEDLSDKSLVLFKLGESFHYIPDAASVLKEPAVIPLPKGSVVEGTITIAGEPSVGENVHLYWFPLNQQNRNMPFGFGGQLTTDDEGKFRYEGLGPGRYWFNRVRSFSDPGAGGLSMYMSSEEVLVEPGKTITHNIQQPAGHRVTGQVLGADAKPIGNCIVSVESVADGERKRVDAGRTDPEGRFQLAHLPPGTFRFTAEHYSRATNESCGIGHVDMRGSKLVTLVGDNEIEIALAPIAHASAESEITGQMAPEFTASLFDSEKSFTLADHLGKIVVLDFWATWCGPCLAVMDETKQLYEKYKDGKDVVFVTISLDQDEERLREVIKERGLAFPVLFDGEGWQSRLAGLFGVHSIPSSFVIGRDGKFTSNRVHASGLAAAIDKALALPIPKDLAVEKLERTAVEITLEGSKDSVPGCKLSIRTLDQDGKMLDEETASLPDRASRYVWRHAPLPPESTVTIQVKAQDCAPIERTLTPSELGEEVSLSVKCPHVLHGKVELIESKTPAAEVEILARRTDGFERTTKADEEGEFHFDVLPGDYTLIVRGSDKFARIGDEKREVSSTPASEAAPLTLNACRTMELRGEVVDTAGKPVPGADMTVYGGETLRSKSAEDGSFAIAGVPSRGTLYVQARKDKLLGNAQVENLASADEPRIVLGANTGVIALGMTPAPLSVFDLRDASPVELRHNSGSETLLVFASLWHPKGKDLARRAIDWGAKRGAKVTLLSTDWDIAQAQRELAALALRVDQAYYAGPGGLAFAQDWKLASPDQVYLLSSDGVLLAAPKPGELPEQEAAPVSGSAARDS